MAGYLKPCFMMAASRCFIVVSRAASGLSPYDSLLKSVLSFTHYPLCYRRAFWGGKSWSLTL